MKVHFDVWWPLLICPGMCQIFTLMWMQSSVHYVSEYELKKTWARVHWVASLHSIHSHIANLPSLLTRFFPCSSLGLFFLLIHVYLVRVAAHWIAFHISVRFILQSEIYLILILPSNLILNAMYLKFVVFLIVVQGLES